MATDWNDYQEEAAAVFRTMGLDAKTNATLHGVRTKHDIDVVVTSDYAGFHVTWLVECKHWKNPVSKLHVLALREIVADIGADRGILLCETGFQSGAIEAANLTNVQVATLEQIRTNASHSIFAMRLQDLYDRIENCRERYWNIPKALRIKHGLHHEVGVLGYSGRITIELCSELVSRAMRGVFPFQTDSIDVFVEFGPDKVFYSAEEVVAIVQPRTEELESKLHIANEEIKKGST